MNKSKVLLSCVGVVLGLVVAVLAFFTWRAFSAKTVALEGDDEGTDGLETVLSKAQRLSSKPVYPCAESVKAVASNALALAAWRDAALKLVATGDRAYPATTPAAFKTFVVADAKRLAALPGGVNGRLAKGDFSWGAFKEYVIDDKMPEEARLATLQRQWDDVALVVEALATAGISELTGVELKSKADEAPKEDEAANGKKKRRNAHKNAKKAKAAEDEGPAAQSYVFSFSTRQVAFVKALNALATCPRFVVVDDFSFTREKDVIAEALGEGEKKSEARPEGGRRRRRAARQAAEEAEKKEDESKHGIVTDPMLDAPFKVEMSVTVYDFRSLEGSDDGVEKTEKASGGAEKAAKSAGGAQKAAKAAEVKK